MFVTGEKNGVEAAPGERTVRRDGSGIRGNAAVRVAALLAAALLVLTASSPGGTEPSSRSSGASADTAAKESAGAQSGTKAPRSKNHVRREATRHQPGFRTAPRSLRNIR